MRKFCFILLFVVFAAASLPAQMITSDVLNIAHLTQLINQVYATYDSIMAAIEQVQNTYEQLKKQADMIMTMPEKFNQFKDDLGKIDLTNPEGFLRFRDQYKDIITYINYNMDLVNNIYDTFTKKKINFGGKNYTFGGLLGMPGSDPGTTVFDLPRNIVEYMDEQVKEGAAGYAGKLTLKQKEALMLKYGLSPRNYYKLRLVENTVSYPFNELQALASKDAEELRMRVHAEKNQYVEDLAAIAGDSMVAQMHTLKSAILNLGDDIQHVIHGLNKSVALSAQVQFKQDTIDEAKASQQLEEANRRKKEDEFHHSAIDFGNW